MQRKLSNSSSDVPIARLSDDYRHPKERSRLTQLEESKKMHALVLSLLKECVDPAVVAVHLTEGAQMAKHPCSL